MAERWRQLSYSGELPSSLVICMPRISARSQGVTLHAPLEDIPVKSKSKQGEAIITGHYSQTSTLRKEISFSYIIYQYQIVSDLV